MAQPVQPPRRAGTVLYQLREGASPADLQRLNGVLNARGGQRARTLAGLNIEMVNFPGNGLSEEALSAELENTGAVLFAEPDYLVEPDAVPNDPDYGNQWHHATINSPTAWDYTTGSPSVLVAVCDSGVQSDHADLAANLQLPGYNSVDGSTNSEPNGSHGTAVAGCVAAVGNNGAGIAGMGWSTKILPIRITNRQDTNAYASDTADGIRYAADEGAKVVNLSYGFANSSTVESAAQYLRDRGGLLFISASNDNQDPGWTDYPSFVAVASTTSSDQRSSFSNWGTYIDITAPGSSIRTTETGSDYGYWSGTSFSSPISAGLAALIYTINPSFTPSQVENFIFSTCVDLGDPGDDNVFGHGRIDAGAALAAASASSSTIKFASIGDFGDNSAAEANVAAMVHAQAPEFIVTPGDNRYGSISYQQAVGDHYGQYLPPVSGGTSPTNLFFPSPGNHDYDDGGGINEYLAYFDLPGAGVTSTNTSGSERYYDVIKGDVHFFLIDSDRAISSSSDRTAQQNWLQTQMSASNSAWQVVVLHHAPYSSANHGNNTTMQWDYAGWGADAVIAGHDHTYERISRDGILYFVNGLGGRSIYSFGTPIAGSAFRYNGDYGAMIIEANATLMTFEFRNTSGTVIDSFSIGSTPPPTGVVDAQISGSLDDVEEVILADGSGRSPGAIDAASTDIELGDDPTHNGDQMEGLIFRNITVPQGATITSAYLEFTVDETDTGATDVTIRAEDADNAADFTTAAFNVSSRTTTAASVAWSVPAWNSVGSVHQSPDISTVVQEVVDRGGWISGNKLAFVIDGTGSRTAESFDGVPASAARLHIEYDTQPTPTGVVDVQISGGSDDVEELATAARTGVNPGDIDPDSTDLELGDDPGWNEDQTVGLLFRNVTVPQAATITAAHLEFTVDEADTETTNVTIRAQDSDNAADFTTASFNVSSRATTSASVGWSIPSWSGQVGAAKQSPDLTAVVQEVVDRSGWASGNKMVFIIDGTGSRTTEAFEGSPTQAARLHIEFDTQQPLPNDPPSAGFTHLTTNLTADFTDTSTDGDGSVVDWDWDFGDGNSSAAQNPSHVYAAAGTYSVNLTVTDDDGASDSISQDVTVTAPNVGPTADFTYIATDLTADFTDTSTDSDGSIVDWDWDFGDGNTSVAQNPSHGYAAAGTYTVNLTVTDDGGASDNISKDVTVSVPNVGPTADFTYLTTDLTADFTDASTDSDGSIVDWDWDFGDGNTSTAQDPSHTYAAAGTYTVTLTVTDDLGATDDATQPVTVTAPIGSTSYYATSELTSIGSVAGNLGNTQASDDSYEALTEDESGGKPANRRSQAQHEWTFQIPAGTSVSLKVEAHHTVNSEGDDFVFSWSSDGTNFTDVLTVTKTTDDDSVQTVGLPSSLAGTVYIRVQDTDRGRGNRSLDTLFVDYLAIEVDTSPVPPEIVSGPVPNDGSLGVDLNADISWNAAAGADSYDVYFGTSAPGSLVGNQTGTSYDPGTLLAATTYFWRIDSVNSFGTTVGPVWSFTTDSNLSSALFEDDFEDGNLSGWTTSGNVSAHSSAAYTGTYGARLRRTSSMMVSIDTSAVDSVQLQYDRKSSGLDSGEVITVDWSADGTVWNIIETTQASSWASMDVTLPAGAAGQSNLRLRFGVNANRNNENAAIDNILVSGSASATATAGASMAASSSTLQSEEQDYTSMDGRLVNISTRGLVETGDHVMIGSFIIQGEAPKTILIRGVGPSLSSGLEVPLLSDPELMLVSHDDMDNPIDYNDNWRDTDEALIMASGLPPQYDSESALVIQLQPGAYSAILSGVNGTTGLGMLEVYEVDLNHNTRLINISTRSFVGHGSTRMVGGFVVGGESSMRVYIRAIGPSLDESIDNRLADPVIDLFSGQIRIAGNDNWTDSDQIDDIVATGIPPGNALEAAMIASLKPGVYSVVVSGADDTTGYSLLEIYSYP